MFSVSIGAKKLWLSIPDVSNELSRFLILALASCLLWELFILNVLFLNIFNSCYSSLWIFATPYVFNSEENFLTARIY